MSAPAAAEVLRPIRVFPYPPTPPGSKPTLPPALIELFLHNLCQEPHHNPFFCDMCGKEYHHVPARSEGTMCTQRPEGGVVCRGRITRQWTTEKAYAEFLRLMAQGGVAIAWELSDPPVPAAFAVCEAHRSDSVIRAIDFPMTVLSSVYGRFGREEPFLVINHLSLVKVAHAQRATVVEKLVKEAAEAHMAQSGPREVTLLIPVSSQTSPEREALTLMLGGKQDMLARDQRPGRSRELWGIKIRAR